MQIKLYPFFLRLEVQQDHSRGSNSNAGKSDQTWSRMNDSETQKFRKKFQFNYLILFSLFMYSLSRQDFETDNFWLKMANTGSTRFTNGIHEPYISSLCLTLLLSKPLDDFLRFIFLSTLITGGPRTMVGLLFFAIKLWFFYIWTS